MAEDDTDIEEAPVVVLCIQCGRGIEVCAFCDNRSCVEAICYRDMIVALREAILQPHDHGG